MQNPSDRRKEDELQTSLWKHN